MGRSHARHLPAFSIIADFEHLELLNKKISPELVDLGAVIMKVEVPFIDVEALIEQLTVDEKIELTAGELIEAFLPRAQPYITDMEH